MSQPTDDVVGEEDVPPGGRGIGRESLWVAAGTGLSRLTGFARVFVLAYAIGQSRLGDLYTKANAAPNLLFELVVGGVISATLVPAFVRARQQRDDGSASALMSVGFIVSTALTVAALAITAIVDLAISDTAGGDVDPHRVVCDLLYLLLPQILFYGISALCAGYLNAARRFRTAAFAPILTNLVSIVAFAIVGVQLQGRTDVLALEESDTGAILWLGLGTTAGIVAMTIPVMRDVARTGAPLRWLPRFRHPAVRSVTRLSGWTFGYVVANQIALLTVLLLLPDNKRYSDAFIFFQLPHGLIAVSIMTTMTPELASAAARADYQALADRFARGLRLLVAFTVPAAVGYVLLATPITSFLRHGNLTAEDARLTSRAVVAFAVGLPAFSIYLFACRGFYALQDTRTPFYLNVVENGINVGGILVLTLADARSATTFGAAYSVAYLVAAGLALWRFDDELRRRDPDLRRPDLATVPRLLTAAFVMGVAVWLVRMLIPDDSGAAAVVAVMVGVVVGAVTYVAAGVMLGADELVELWDRIRRRMAR